MGRQLRSWALALILALAVPFILRGPAKAITTDDRASVDFGPLYGATRAWLTGGDPYDIPTLQAAFHAGGGKEIHLPNDYFPPMLPIAALAAWAPWQVARWIWLTINLLACGAAVYCATQMADWQPPIRYLPLVWVLAAWPAVIAIQMGQPAVLATALTVGAIWLTVRNRQLPAGFALALALSVKPTLAIAGVLFCLLQKRFRAVVIGCLIFLSIYAGVLLTAWPQSLTWAGEMRGNILREITDGVNSPLPSGPEITNFLNLQPVAGMFTENLTAGNAIVFALASALLVLFFVKNRAAESSPGWPGALTLSVALALAGGHHRYPDALLLIALIPACYTVYANGHRAIALAMAGILAILSMPLQSAFEQRFHLSHTLQRHQPAEMARVLLLFHHESLLLLALALLSFAIAKYDGRITRMGYPAVEMVRE
jgi:hypothetical protein